MLSQDGAAPGPEPLQPYAPAVIRALDTISVLVGARAPEQAVEKGQDLLHAGEVPKSVHILIAGHTCRYRVLSDGRRQITAILVPGDLCDLDAAMHGRAAYAIGALTRCVVGQLPAELISDEAGRSPALTAALLIQLRRDEAIAREWIVNLGRRSAVERTAHLLCELRVRLAAVGLADEESYKFRITQADLADALGLSSVHLNRALQELRGEGLIILKEGLLTMRDRPALEAFAQFDPAYLQL